ncbi:MAG: hypothetical protein PHG96_11120 [Kiritimatiellae bacterium]|nr:hypothetical protein [Kiritimatiellia bacterium]
MKKELTMVFCAGLAGAVLAQAAEKAETEGLDWDGGADLRVRHELHDNVPQHNAGGAVSGNQSYLRIRPRVWGAVKNEDFKLHVRLADEFREYFHPSESRNAQFPDEVLVDNLYLDLYGLFGDRLDLRVGRQDFIGPQGPEYGAGRVLLDGSSGDGSRTCFFDAIKATIKFDEKNTLDLLAIYNKAENELSWGHNKGADGSYPKEKQMTYNVPGATDMDEYGGGLYFKSREFKEFPFDLYYLFKRETKARFRGATLPGRDTHTLGARVMPQLTETLSAEFEGAAQAGELDGGNAARGYMGYAGLTYKPAVESCKPYVTMACYYLSGDRNGADDNDTSWNPLWARWPQYSEMYPYQDRGVCYWSNLIYPNLTVGSRFANGHKVSANVGPMYAAVEDDLGGGNGDLYGWFGMFRYDFPLLKNIFGKRGDLTGHVTAEVLDPGDYYVSDTVAYFLRWEVIARF